MEFLGWLVFFYIVVAFGCWMRFGRQFLFAKDIRRPRNADVWDAFPPMFSIFLLGITLMVLNPARFVRAAGKSVLWPVTLYRWFERQGAIPTGSASVPSGVTATVRPPKTLGQPDAVRSEPPADEPTASPGNAPGTPPTSERFAAKTMAGPLSLPGTPMPHATSGPPSGRHMAGPTAGDAAPHWGAPVAGAPAWGRPPGAPAAASWSAAPPPMWGAPNVTGGPVARPATQPPPRHRGPGDQ